MELLSFYKLRKVKSPCRAHWQDAGIDFFVPDDFPTHITVYPQERICIPSGIRVRVPFGYALIAFNKSGVATKLGLDKLAEVVDCGYEGEIHISVVNTSKNPVHIYPGQKLIQFILVQIGTHIPCETIEDLRVHKSERGVGGFGSTGGE